MRDVCNINTFIVKWGKENINMCHFDLIEQSGLFQRKFIFGEENFDYLIIFYTFIKTSFYPLTEDKYFFDNFIIPKTPIKFKNGIPYNIDINTNNTMIVREIFRLCEEFELKLELE